MFCKQEKAKLIRSWALGSNGQSRDSKLRECALGAELLLGSTFAPPPLSTAFAFEADVIPHIGTKYIAGHSHALPGLLVVALKS